MESLQSPGPKYREKGLESQPPTQKRYTKNWPGPNGRRGTQRIGPCMKQATKYREKGLAFCCLQSPGPKEVHKELAGVFFLYFWKSIGWLPKMHFWTWAQKVKSVDNFLSKKSLFWAWAWGGASQGSFFFILEGRLADCQKLIFEPGLTKWNL